MSGDLDDAKTGELRQWLQSQLERAERMEAHAMDGNHDREAARNSGRATAFEMTLRKMDALNK